jgi:adenylyltransferase/sulfurtransferase
MDMVDLERYDRQYILPQIGEDGQKKLIDSRVAIIGCGALGGHSSTLLTRAGIGFIRVIDRDVIELDNLQRQVLFDEKDVGKPKANAAENRLKGINSDVRIEGVVDDVNFSNVLEYIKEVDLVVDGADNMETRYLVNDACVKTGTPFIYGGAISTYGMTMTVIPKKSACLSCIFPNYPLPGSLPTCETAGILNSVPAVIAALQTTSAIKILLGHEPNTDLTLFDAWTNELREVRVKRNTKCRCCSEERFVFLEAESKDVITSLCGRNAISINPLRKGSLDLEMLGAKLEKLGNVKSGDTILIFSTGEHELMIFRDGRAIIKGTDDERVARSLYSKYVGN